jgi:hypothetical protein
VVRTYLESLDSWGCAQAKCIWRLRRISRIEISRLNLSPFYQRSLYQSMRNLVVQNFQLLREV